MKYYIKLLIVLNLCCFFSYSQPKNFKKNIPIDSYSRGKLSLLNYKFKNGVNYYYLTNQKTKLKRNVYSNEKNSNLNNLVFIFKSDTMRLNIKYSFRDDLELKIKNFNFIKGNYNINLYEYVNEKIKKLTEIEFPFVIENFPNDCLAYKKQEIEK